MPNNNFSSQSNGPKLSEAFVKPVKDEVGKMIETGIQSITGITPTPLSPEEEAKKQQEEELKKQQEELRKRNIMQFFESLKANQQASIQQEQYFKQQTKQQEIQEGQQVKQFEIQKKQQKRDITLDRAQRRTEIKVKGG